MENSYWKVNSRCTARRKLEEALARKLNASRRRSFNQVVTRPTSVSVIIVKACFLGEVPRVDHALAKAPIRLLVILNFRGMPLNPT